MRSDILTALRAVFCLQAILWPATAAPAGVSRATAQDTSLGLGLLALAAAVIVIVFLVRRYWPRKKDEEFVFSSPEAEQRYKDHVADQMDRMNNPWKYKPEQPPTSTNYGSARWAEPLTRPQSAVDFRGVFFGKSSQPGMDPSPPTAPVYSRPEGHTLIVARTRAGKGTRVILPTLLRYDHSMLVIDPKGENAAVAARMRRDRLYQTVHIVNPWGVLDSHYKDLGFAPATYNPLDAIDRKDHNAVALAQSMAATICPVTPGKEAYWQGSAANVLTGVFLWLAETPGEQKTLGRARELVTQSREEFKKTLARMVSSSAFSGAIKEMVAQYLDLAPETYSGIMSNLAESTKFLSDPQIKRATGASSFSMKTLREDPTTIFLVIPPDRVQTHATWLRLVIASAMHAIKTRAPVGRAGEPGSTEAKYRCMFLIDEFGSLGHIPDVPRDIAVMSGYGLDFTFILQGIDQLKTHYGEAKGTILNNCSWKWFCNVADLDTAKYLSETLGRKTVKTVSTGESKRETGDKQSEGESTTYGETGRSLLTPDEILNLGRDTAILLNPLGAPHYLQPIDYWKLEDAFQHLKQGWLQFYWPMDRQGRAAGLAYDPNPYIKR